MIIKTRAVMRALLQRRTRIVDHNNAHPPADLNIDLDNGYRELRQVCSEAKWTHYLTTTGALALPTTASAGETFVVLDVPDDALLIKKLELNFGGDWGAAEEVDLAQLRHFQGSPATSGGHAWCLLDSGIQATLTQNTGSADEGVIALSPVPRAGNYQIWYLKEFAGTTADSGAGGFYVYANDDHLKYHLYATAVEILISDNDSQGMLAGCIEQLKRFEARIRNSAPTKTGPRTWRRARNY